MRTFKAGDINNKVFISFRCSLS